jgi:hypothetical protein
VITGSAQHESACYPALRRRRPSRRRAHWRRPPAPGKRRNRVDPPSIGWRARERPESASRAVRAGTRISRPRKVTAIPSQGKALRATIEAVDGLAGTAAECGTTARSGSRATAMAPVGHTRMQAWQSVQRSCAIRATPSTTWMASSGHTSWHAPHPVQRSEMTYITIRTPRPSGPGCQRLCAGRQGLFGIGHRGPGLRPWPSTARAPAGTP